MDSLYGGLMKVLVVGGGGREHAIVWKLSQSEKVNKIYCVPGNAGISKIAECVAYKATDMDNITQFAINNKIDLVFVAPDDPLAMGLVNKLTENGIRTFGPTKEASVIESSKAFSKELMRKYSIPTAGYEIFTDSKSAIDYIETLEAPIVVKADGLALGKGVIIALTQMEAKTAVREMLENNAFGDAGKKVLIEEFLTGKELTVLAFSDGRTVVPMPNSRDHKRALDNDLGLNTGGMGAICPGEVLSASLEKEMENKIFIPTINAMMAEGRPFKGVIYFGLMLTDKGPKVIEYNARFGDPEAQAILPLLKTDFIDIINAVIDEKLENIEITWENMSSCCIVAASGGYPQSYKTGFEIKGLEGADCLVFHAGTKFDNSKVVTSGGRVLGVTAVSETLPDAIEKAYKNIKKIKFDSMHYRNDIGKTK